MAFGRVGNCVAVAVLLATALCVAVDPVAAAPSDEAALADRFAPVVRLVDQPYECGPGEPYQPSDVDAFLGNDTVALRGPWDHDDLIKVAPSARDLGNGLTDYHLDFPGNPLQPGCDYERWARDVTAGTPPTTYAHVATEEGYDDRLGLQFWFYYPFNDYNNKHESDWEMIQLVFAAASAAEALDQTPIAVGYSQHEGVETAEWDDEKLEIVDGTHPVVYPAAGSHANFYDSALYLGRSGSQGFGCDDTREPNSDVTPAVKVIPKDTAAARAEFPWIGYEGRWGQREQSFFNAPRGPNLSDRWNSPISFQEEHGRDRSYAVPAGGLLGTQVTDFFCSGVAGGSDALRILKDDPAPLLIAVVLVLLLAIYLIRRTTWRPTAPLHAGRRRASGQVIASAARMYAAHWLHFVTIGLLIVPTSLLVSGLQSLIIGVGASGGEEGGFRVALATIIGYLILGASVAFVFAATARSLAEFDDGNDIGVVEAYRLSLVRWRSLVGAFAVWAIAVGLFSLTVVLMPIAAVLVISFALFVPVVVLEDQPALAAIRRSAHLVRHRILKVAVLLAISIALAVAIGPVLGIVTILATDAPFTLVNVFAGVTFAFLMPYVGLTIAYIYYDTRIRARIAAATPRQNVLPAES